MLERRNAGQMCLRGQAATEIVALYHHINGVLACPLLFGPEGAACEGAQQRPAFYRELFPQLRRARAMLREVMAGLRYSGALQATFASIVCATRFKFFHGGSFLPSECAYCDQTDSLSHLPSCVNIGRPPVASEELCGIYGGACGQGLQCKSGDASPH